MNKSELFAFLCAKSSQEAGEIWRQANPGKPQFHITNDPGIKRYWKSPLGRFNKSIILLFSWWARMGDNFDLLRWRIGFEWRSFYSKNFSQSKNHPHNTKDG